MGLSGLSQVIYGILEIPLIYLWDFQIYPELSMGAIYREPPVSSPVTLPLPSEYPMISIVYRGGIQRITKDLTTVYQFVTMAVQLRGKQFSSQFQGDSCVAFWRFHLCLALCDWYVL